MRPSLRQLPSSQTRVRDAFGFGTDLALAKKERAIEHMGGACFGCGRVVLSSMFEFHHWDASEKSFGISRDGMARPWDLILAELAKCVMLCANCHREVHAGVRSIARPELADEANAA